MQDTTSTAKATWTLAYRKPRANKIHRVTDWSGTWAQAHDLCAAAYDATGGALQIWYTSTREAELAGFVCEDDIQNMLVDSGKRVPLTETGTIAALGIDPATALPLPAADARAWGYVKPTSATIEAAHAEALEMNAERDEAAKVWVAQAWRRPVRVHVIRDGIPSQAVCGVELGSTRWTQDLDSTDKEQYDAMCPRCRAKARDDSALAARGDAPCEVRDVYAQPCEPAAPHVESGYTPCACRDCMDVTVSDDITKPELCALCQAAGCTPNNGECQRPDAYGAEADEPTTEPTDPDDAVKARARLAVALGIDPFGPIPPLTELVDRIVSERDALRAPVANRAPGPTASQMDETDLIRSRRAYLARRHRHAAGGQR